MLTYTFPLPVYHNILIKYGLVEKNLLDEVELIAMIDVTMVGDVIVDVDELLLTIVDVCCWIMDVFDCWIKNVLEKSFVEDWMYIEDVYSIVVVDKELLNSTEVDCWNGVEFCWVDITGFWFVGKKYVEFDGCGIGIDICWI